MEDIACVDRKQRHGATEENREQIERDGAEHDLLRPDIAESGEQCFEAFGLLGNALHRLGDQADKDSTKGEQE